MDPKDVIPDSEFVPDKSSVPDIIPDNEFKPDSVQASPPDIIPDSEFKPDNSTPSNISHESPVEMLKTGAEGLAEGAIGKLAPAIETKYLGVNSKDIEARKQANPNIALATDLTGSILPFFTPGSSVIKGAMLMGGQAATDELGKYLMDEKESPSAAAAHIIGSSALGYGFGKAGERAAKYTKNALENSKVGSKLMSWISGLGEAASKRGAKGAEHISDSVLEQMEKTNPETFSAKSFRNGHNAYNSLIANLIPGTAGAYYEHSHGRSGVGGFAEALLLKKYLGKYLQKITDPLISKGSQKYIAPVISKVSSSNMLNNFSKWIDHAGTIDKGLNITKKAVDGIFEGTSGQVIDQNLDHREKIDQHLNDTAHAGEMEKNQATGYADGGQVLDSSSEEHPWPEQKLLLDASKARTYNYLKSLKPIPNPKSLYDSEHVDKSKERQYHRAMDVAHNPVSVLDKIKKGTLLPSHVKDLNSMYPEVHEFLSKKLTERMLEGKLNKEKKPPYAVRQALSLFLGNNVDSTLSQPNIAAAQMVFMKQKAQQPVAKNVSPKEMSDQYVTPDQSRERRLNKD